MRSEVSRSTNPKVGWGSAAVSLIAVALSGFVAAPATAAEAIPVVEVGDIAMLGLTDSQVRRAHDDFQDAGTSFDAVKNGGLTVNVYHFPEGDFGLVVPPEPGAISTKMAVGSDAQGQYLSLNHTDQLAIKNGSTAALTLAITLLNPAVGGAVSVFTAVAGTYLNDHGICSGNDELWIYYRDGPTGPAYSQVTCRPVSYPGGG